MCKAGYQVSLARFRVSQELSSAWFPCRLEMAGLAREPAQKKMSRDAGSDCEGMGWAAEAQDHARGRVSGTQGQAAGGQVKSAGFLRKKSEVGRDGASLGSQPLRDSGSRGRGVSGKSGGRRHSCRAGF